MAPERVGDDRQQRHGPVRPRRDAGDHRLGDTSRRGRHLRRHAGRRRSPDWSWLYLAANAVSLVVAIAVFYPRQALVLKTGIYFKRLPDALYVAGAEVLFYLQSELDKLLVLALGGAQLAGIYAIIMRLVDLTAIPIRAFTMMLVQKMMRAPETLARLGVRAGIEAGIFAVSTLALLCLAILLHFFPGMLGRNVAEAAPLDRAGHAGAGLAQSGGIPGRAVVRARPNDAEGAEPRFAGAASRRCC